MQDPPNIVLVSADSLRADHCGFLDDGRDLTPTLDAMAEDGVVFENAVSTGPQTLSSMPAVFTGRHLHPDVYSAQAHDSAWERAVAAISVHLDRFPPIQQRLEELGYSTAAFTPNPWTSTASGFDRGFDHFYDFSTADEEGVIRELVERLPGVDPESKPVEMVMNKLTGSSFFARWDSFYEEFDRQRRQLEEPYFLWVFLLDTHIPYITSRRHRQENSLPEMYYGELRAREATRGHVDSVPDHVHSLVRRSYRDTVRAVDAFLDRFLDDAAADDPVTVFHSDHGESFGERGHYGHHHRRVYEENLHVPYVVHGAGVRERVSAPTSLSTVYDAVTSIAAGERFDPSELATEYAVASSSYGTHRTVRGRRWKYIEEDEEQLYDLAADPDERRNLASSEPETLERLRRRLEAFDRRQDEELHISRTADSLATLAEV